MVVYCYNKFFYYHLVIEHNTYFVGMCVRNRIALFIVKILRRGHFIVRSAVNYSWTRGQLTEK